MLFAHALRLAETALQTRAERMQAPGLVSLRGLNAAGPEQDSFVFRADMGEAGSVIAKVAPPGRLAAQFARLQAVHPAMSDGLCRVPRPISYDQESGVLLMEDAWGMAAQTLFTNGGGGAARALVAAGRWLHRYHGLTATRAPFNPAPHLNWLRKSIAAHHDGARVIPQIAALEAHLPAMEALAEQAREATSVRCITHRDFHLRNLLVRKHGRAYGIDMENGKTDEAMRDLLFFLADTARASTDDPTPAGLQTTAERLCRAYGRPTADRDARRFFQRSFALNQWAALNGAEDRLSEKQQRSLLTAQAFMLADDLLAPPEPANQKGQN